LAIFAIGILDSRARTKGDPESREGTDQQSETKRKTMTAICTNDGEEP
jgi:hypothetical protein